VAVDGSFSVGLQLTPGRWQLNVTGASAAGVAAAPVAVTIVVPYKGIQVLVEIEGGPATLKIWRDGVLDTKDSKTYQSGDRIQINANANVWVWTGVASRTYVTVNGVAYGHLSSSAIKAAWSMDGASPPKRINVH
jgi:hypothetical protein